MSKEGSPTVTDTETGETTFGRPRKFSSGGMVADVMGPAKPKGSVSPKIRAYDDDFKYIGAGVNITLKKV
jgi:hypothetical protein